MTNSSDSGDRKNHSIGMEFLNQSAPKSTDDKESRIPRINYYIKIIDEIRTYQYKWEDKLSGLIRSLYKDCYYEKSINDELLTLLRKSVKNVSRLSTNPFKSEVFKSIKGFIDVPELNLTEAHIQDKVLEDIINGEKNWKDSKNPFVVLFWTPRNEDSPVKKTDGLMKEIFEYAAKRKAEQEAKKSTTVKGARKR